MLSKIKLYAYLVNLLEELEYRDKQEEMYLTYLRRKLQKLREKKEHFVVKIEYDVDMGDLNY